LVEEAAGVLETRQTATHGGATMAELAKWPELEILSNPLEPEAAALAPVEIRFQVKPEPGEKWDTDMAAECSVADRPAATPGAVLSFREWEQDPDPTLYCYAIARNLQEGAQVKLKVRPRGEKKGEDSETVWEKEFIVKKEGDKFRLE
jgi:hypothetical protein